MAQQETLLAGWVERGAHGVDAPVVQIAEPFDGTHKAESFTPLIAAHVQRRWGATAVSLCAPSAGPKWGPNLHSIARELCPISFAVGSREILEGAMPPEFGWYVDQEASSKALTRWIDIRRNVIKRPFLATSEKFLDVCGATVLIASAFHPSFSDKMFDMAEQATHFGAVIIVRKGCEGSLGFSLARPAEVTVGVRRSDGSLARTDFAFGPDDAGVQRRAETEQQCPPLSAASTAAKIARFAAQGSSGDAVFDDRVKLTLAGVDKALAIALL